MAMTKTEQKIKDLNIDYLVSVSNAALKCQDTIDGYRHGVHAIAAAIVISTPEGRNELHNKKELSETATALVEMYYNLAKERGLYFYVKSEERSVSNKKDAPPNPNSRGSLLTH